MITGLLNSAEMIKSAPPAWGPDPAVARIQFSLWYRQERCGHCDSCPPDLRRCCIRSGRVGRTSLTVGEHGGRQLGIVSSAELSRQLQPRSGKYEH